jgi:PAS domain-containing protein
MNLPGNTEAKFVREWQAGERPLHRCMANPSRWDGVDPALGQEQATFEALFNALPAATVLTDLYGEIRLVNPAFTTLFGSPLMTMNYGSSRSSPRSWRPPSTMPSRRRRCATRWPRWNG